MARDVGTRAFRRELDAQEERIGVLEESGGEGGEGGQLSLIVLDEAEFDMEVTSLRIGAGLDATATDVDQARIRSAFRIESNGEGFGFGPDEQLRGIQLGDGLVMEKDLSGEQLAIISVRELVRFEVREEAPAEYTLQESDVGKMLKVPLLGGGEGEEEVFEITIPKDADEDLPVGARIGVMAYGGFATGIISILRGDGVVFVSLHETVQSTSTLGAFIYFIKVGPNEWLIEDRNGFSIT